MRCPGQDSRYWKHDAIFETKCPQCHHEIEFFKDQTTARCQHCGKQVINPRQDFGCASYCQYAEQCLGELPPELLAGREDLLKDRVALRMKMHFRKDFKNIGQATKVARLAQQLAAEEGARPAILLCAAYLHNIGCPAGSTLPLGEPPANEVVEQTLNLSREILSELKAQPEMIDQVRTLLADVLRNKAELSLEGRCLHDALLIYAWQTRKEMPDEEKINEVLLTGAGRQQAKRQFCAQ